MLGAIAGDVIGSVYEGTRRKTKRFQLFSADSRFTDDTVLTVAVSQAVLHRKSYRQCLRELALRYPKAGYGKGFREWLSRPNARSYRSIGNGSAMRVSPTGWAFDDLKKTLSEARKSAAPTHNHPEAIAGAQAIAGSIFLARTGHGKDDIREFLKGFGYDCSRNLRDVRRTATLDLSCRGTVPAAAIAFLDSDDFEDTIRNAVSLGGDTDTLACIAGSLAESFYGGVPELIRSESLARLDETLRSLLGDFLLRFGVPLTASAR